MNATQINSNNNRRVMLYITNSMIHKQFLTIRHIFTDACMCLQTTHQ